MDNSYSQFIMTNLAVANDLIDKDEDYDIMWGKGGELLAEFEGSSYDVDSKSEIDCMVDFFNHKKRELKNKEKLWDRQIELQENMQIRGFNIVTCGNCDTLIIHKTDSIYGTKEHLNCHGCGTTIAKSDCSDYYYNGMPKR